MPQKDKIYLSGGGISLLFFIINLEISFFCVFYKNMWGYKNKLKIIQLKFAQVKNYTYICSTETLKTIKDYE